jgi:integrase
VSSEGGNGGFDPHRDPHGHARPRTTGGRFVAEKKRGNGEGGKPRKRPDGRWEARYWKDGKRKSVYGATRKEVAQKLAKALATKNEPPQFIPTNMTVQEFFQQYQDAVKDTMKRRSFETCQDIARLHLLPAFGGKKLKDLSREHVQRMYSHKRDTGLSAARVRRIHSVLSSALNTAVRWHLIQHNACEDVTPPKVQQPEIRPFSLEEAKRFIATAEGDRYEALFILGLTSGARWGELTGLFWSDLDLDRRVMHIQRSLINGYGGYTFDTPKTSGGRRSVRLARKATDALTRHRERMRDEGHNVDGDVLVFVNKVGKPLHASNFIRRCSKPLLKRAGLPDTNWHAATRHTATCILLLEGVNPKSVAMQMGWSSVAFMLEHYARFLPGWGDNGVMDAALS